jgi:transposase
MRAAVGASDDLGGVVAGCPAVERCFSRLKQWRGIATRYDKKASNYCGGVLLAALILWTRA